MTNTHVDFAIWQGSRGFAVWQEDTKDRMGLYFPVIVICVLHQVRFFFLPYTCMFYRGTSTVLVLYDSLGYVLIRGYDNSRGQSILLARIYVPFDFFFSTSLIP